MVIKEERKKKKRGIGHKDWWDRSCTRKKKMVRRLYRSWKRGRISRNYYIEERRKLKIHLDEKKKSWTRKEEEELKSLKNNTEVWKFINKKRGKRIRIENNISKQEWENHFLELLEGVRLEEGMVTEEKEENIRKGTEGEEEEGEEIEEEEIVQAIKRMKKRKAAEVDGIPMEAWIYGGITIRKGLVDIIKQAWREGVIPKDWETSVTIPIFKKGDQERAENYRGISLLCTAYKVYAEVLRRRLEKEVERGEILPESQTAFDKVDREKLWEVMEDKGINKNLIGRIRRIYKVTRNVVRTEEDYGGISNEERNDMVILAKNRVAAVDMMKTLERFLRERRLALNTEKTKIMVFSKGGKEKKVKWNWLGKELEEVQVFSYLGFTFNRKGDYKDHLKVLEAKGRRAANRVWGYLITRELELDKLKIKWGINARRYEEKIKEMGDNRWVKVCWKEKQEEGWTDLYGREREAYYNRNGW
ncbi:PREDICTED: uncharacterized protein LOC105557104, partial [Vollenhovia emeryi]|uniref:uncharacterized protein LOC105557104 n=1 Tax=Vollenhovia emeryi TaxID=411798 RepID=UPI0005F38DDE